MGGMKMSVKILVPNALQPYTDKQDTVEVEGATAGEALAALTERHPALRKHLYGDSGELRQFVNVYVGSDDMRHLQGIATPVKDGDELSIVPSIAGGSEAIPLKGLESIQLSNEEVLRYSRHLIMPEVALDGQKKLKAASVLCIGAGGLGSPLAMYLAAAGVGTIGIVDFDVVDFTNLQRQIIHGTEDVGKSKLQSAKETLKSINPFVKVEGFEAALSSENAMEILKQFDIIVDGTDNFPTRYLVNDA